MANNSIKMDLQVHDKGGSIKARTEETKQLNRELEKAQSTASKTFAAQSSDKASGGIAGFTMGGGDYTRARGTSSATGASARDFAAQAQGLGGLVRLYATWAANIYAAGAAFESLRSAMNTTNMVQGMNQLGAASGVALGSLAKQFAQASGGALSMQDAVSSTVKAMSSGLSQEQFQQLGDVANKASRALGVNMADAVSRLTRGITKLEPELLDELGIFTKVGKSTEDYAKSVGKTAASISDFEKRQAFANAVLEEGAKKFGDIDIDANPYDKLAASLANLKQNTLELANTVLGPIIGALSASPTALSVAVGAFSLMLLKQAIPAVGQYRLALALAADESAKRWKARSDDIKKITEDRYQHIVQSAHKEADARAQILDDAEANLKKIREKAAKGGSAVDAHAMKILGKIDPKDVRAEDIRYLKDAANIQRTLVNGNKELADSYDKGRIALLSWVAGERNAERWRREKRAQAEKEIAQASPFRAQGRARDQAESARQRSASSGLVSAAAETTNLRSMREAWAELQAGIKTEKLTGATKVMTRLTGAVTVGATAFIRVISVLASFLGWVGLAIGVVTTLYGWLSKNEEQARKFSEALDLAKDSASTAKDTFAKFSGVISSEALIASSNAMAGLAASVANVTKAFIAAEKASNWADNLWDGIKDIFGQSMGDDAGRSIATGLMTMLDNIDSPEAKKHLENKIKGLLNIRTVSFTSISEKIDDLPADKIKPLIKEMAALEIKEKAVADATRSVSEAMSATDVAFKDITNSFTQTDPLSKYVQALGATSKTMAEAFKNPEVALATYADIVKDVSKLNAFPPEARSEILAQAQEYANLTTQAEALRNELDTLNEKRKELSTFGSTPQERMINNAARKRVAVELELNSAAQKKFSGQLANLSTASLNKAFELALDKVNKAAQQASIDRSKAILSFLPESPETIRAQMALDNQSIEIRKKEITALYTLTTELTKIRLDEAIGRVEEKIRAARPEDVSKFTPERDQLIKDRLAINSKNLAEDLKSGAVSRTPEVLAQLQAQQGFMDQLAGLVGQQEVNRINAALKSFSVGLDNATKTQQSSVDDARTALDKRLATENISAAERAQAEEKYLRDTEKERLALAVSAEQKAVDISNRIIKLFPNSKEAAYAQEALRGTNTTPGQLKVLENAKNRAKSTETATQAIAAQKSAQESLNETLAEQGQALDANAQLQELNGQRALQALNISKDQALQDLANFGVTSDAQARQLKALDLEILAQEKSNALALERATYARQTLEWQEKLKNAAALKLSASDISLLNKQLSDEAVAHALRMSHIDKEYEGKEKLRQQQIDDTTRLGAYTVAFQNAFKGMEDAIIEFTKTGKLSFSSMIDSFIEELLRFEIRQMQSSMFSSLGGAPGMAKALISAIGLSTTGDLGMGSVGSVDTALLAPGSFRAKGAAYDLGGVEKFAKGGTFTNSVVSSPTLFKFAKGTGLMGEAGPEAIMPLRRDNSGNLGVMSGGNNSSNVDIVINNYGNDKATATETTDARGNRRIEVVIGDMSSGEISRSGSATQRALASTFGVKPTTIRR